MNKTSFRLVSVSHAVLLILLCVSFVFTMMSAVTGYIFLDAESYTAFTKEETFVTDMTAFVREELESDCLFYDLPFSVVDDSLSEQRICVYTEQYANELYEALLFGKSMDSLPWDSAPYTTAVLKFFESLPKEDRPLNTPLAAETIGNELALTAKAVLDAGFNQSLLNTAHRLLNHPMVEVAGNSFWMLAGITAVLAVLCGITGLHAYKRSFYNIGLSMAIGGIVGFVPCWLLQGYDISARLSVMDSPIKLYIDGILNTIVDRMVVFTGCCLLITVALFLIAVIVSVRPQKSTPLCN